MKNLAVLLLVLFISHSGFCQKNTMNDTHIYRDISVYLNDKTSFLKDHEVISNKPGECISILDILPPTEEEISKKDTWFFKNLCYCAHHIFMPKNKEAEYIGFLYTPPTIPRNEDISDYDLLQFNFDKIKADLNWGDPHSGANQQDKHELKKLIFQFTTEEAISFAKIPIVLTYPYDMKGKIYNNKYSRCRCYVFYNGIRAYYLYLLATNSYATNFEENILRDFKGVFNFSSFIEK